ncbi:hypothetical protein B9T31_12215 [Acinetobacter sp. ANC 4558]|nr:hypothetical protein B9T31_12215 [Acinetobacter sp. ANC 4558]
MNKYDATLTVFGFNENKYKLSQCKIDIRKKIIYTKDLSTEVKNGYWLIREFNTGYSERYLVIHVCKKASLKDVNVIHIMRF